MSLLKLDQHESLPCIFESNPSEHLEKLKGYVSCRDEVMFSKTQENSLHETPAWVLLCETADNNIKGEFTEEK